MPIKDTGHNRESKICYPLSQQLVHHQPQPWPVPQILYRISSVWLEKNPIWSLKKSFLYIYRNFIATQVVSWRQLLQHTWQQHKNIIIIVILSSKIVYQSNLPIWHCIWNFYLFILLVGLQCIGKQHWMKNIWPVKQINHQFFSFWRNKNMKT